MRKIAIIGAGSVVFCKTLMLDIMATPGLADTQFSLMAPSMRHTSQVKSFINRVIEKNNLPTKVSITTDQREALSGADYVIATLQIGGVQAFELDYQIPMDFGVDQCIGDSMGPGGIFRALRTIPVMRKLAQDMKELCPDALLLNYVNPMAMICWGIDDIGIKYVGLCHGVQTTLDLISGYVGVPKEEIDFVSAGINHMGWFTKIEHKGKDLYPILREKFEEPGYYVNEKVRGEVFRHYGYFMTESTGHLSEYIPWFRSGKAAMDLYCDEPSFGGETGAYLKWGKHTAEKYDEHMLDSEPTDLPPRSVEYCSYIIEAIEGITSAPDGSPASVGKTFKFNGNLRNNGAITNLPADCCSEGPVFADKTGLNRVIVGDIPAQCAALNMTNINVQRLAVQAAITCDPQTVVHACSLDPLTSACLTLREINEMVTAMFKAEAQWLPHFKGKLPRPTPTISIPKDVKRADVPIDPALAIYARFGELSK